MQLKVISVLLCMVLVSACGAISRTSNADTDLHGAEKRMTSYVGFVVKKEENTILVVSPDAKELNSASGVKEFYDAIWFSGAPANIEIGMMVEARTNQVIQSSYPGKSHAEEVRMLSKANVAGTEMIAARAVQKALATLALPDDEFAIVKSVAYDPEKLEWIVTVLEGSTQQATAIKIKDIGNKSKRRGN